jgi:ATP-dependent exoDNAse (exonuclease V) beta subunit
VGAEPEHQHPPPAAGGRDPVPEPATEIAAALPDLDDWRRARDEAVAVSAVPTTVAATALTDDGRPDAVADPGLHKRPRDLDLPPWQKGRYGTAIGRAVHAVMQTIDLATGAGKQEAVAAQAAAEGVIGHEPRVAALVDAALAAPTVAEAAGAPHWRELYVGVPLEGGRTLEGYVDLLYRRDDGLVVVDYKTGPAGLDADLDALVARYRMQGAAYALAVADATGEPVVEVTFVFLTPEGPAERHLPDLAPAVAEVRHLAASPDGRLVTT